MPILYSLDWFKARFSDEDESNRAIELNNIRCDSIIQFAGGHYCYAGPNTFYANLLLIIFILLVIIYSGLCLDIF